MNFNFLAQQPSDASDYSVTNLQVYAVSLLYTLVNKLDLFFTELDSATQCLTAAVLGHIYLQSNIALYKFNRQGRLLNNESTAIAVIRLQLFM